MSLGQRNYEQIRVLIADCTRMACQLLADAISQDPKIKVVSAVTSTEEALQVVLDTSPDMVLLGAEIDGYTGGGPELARQLRLINPELLIVILLDRLNGTNVIEAFRAYASGVFVRDGSVESLRKCIHTVAGGQVWASTEVLRFVLGALAGTSTPVLDANSMALLTKRERQVIALAVDGVKNREIARSLNLSEHTVKNYLFSIFGKLGVSSRLELTLAIRREWIQQSNIIPMRPLGVDTSTASFDQLCGLAEQGLVSAQFLLAQLHSEGRGVPHDRTQAYRLFLLAEESAQIIDASGRARKKLAAEMSRAEISEAERQAAKWLEEKRKQLLAKPSLTESHPKLKNRQ